ncbi:MAG: 2-oxo acid dehydrogenase subunit E2 [Bacteroidota bacterium]
MFRQKGDEVIRVGYGQRVLMDVLDAARRPDSYAVMLLDMSAAEAFRKQYRKKHGVALTNLHLIIKAVAETMDKEPWVNYMVDGYKIIKPSSIDIGVSVAANEGVTPVVVIKEANKKSLQEIRQELTSKASEAVEQEKENLEKLNRLARWIPLNFMRRLLVRYLANQYRLRRSVIGTVQITSVGLKDLDFHLPSHIGTTCLFSVGGIVRRPVVVGDRIEIRPTVYLACQVDTRVVNAVRGVRAFRRLRRFIEHPQQLEDGCDLRHTGAHTHDEFGQQ